MSFSRFFSLTLLLVVVSALAAHAQSEPWGVEQKLTANDAEAGIGFGDSAALQDSIAVVGATANGRANLSAGAAYVLRWNEVDAEWQHTVKLTADDGELDDRFGWSVSLDGDVIVVGAPDDSVAGDLSGSAYVFRWDGGTWIQEQKLTPDDGAERDRFGRSVAVSGDVIVIGSPDAEVESGPTGAAYVFRWDGEAWQQEQKIQVGTFATISELGASVAASGDRLLIGVPDAGPGAQNLGAAYVFRYDEAEAMWLEEQRLSASDEDPQDRFGFSVTLDGDVALIGVPQDEEAATTAGAAYVFRWNGEAWQEEQKLLADDAGEGDRFGDVVALKGNVAVIGAPQDDNERGNGAGGAYVFAWNGETWQEEQKLLADDPEESGIGDHFGESVAFDGVRILAGASNSDENGESSGSAYVLRRGATSIAVTDDELPASVLAFQTYPNPFRQNATLAYTLSQPERVRLNVYDLLGRRVAQLADGWQTAGLYTTALDAKGLPAGVYLARLETETHTLTRLMLRVD